MGIEAPQPLDGITRAANWLNRLRAFAIASRILSGVGYKVRTGPQGTYLELEGLGGGGFRSNEYRLKSVQGDYVTCRTWRWNATAEEYQDGSADIYIAKEYRLRESCGYGSPPVENGYTYTYSGAAPNRVRRKTLGGDYEDEVVIPIWTVNEIISAIPANTSVETEGADPQPVTLLMVSNKAWAKVYTP